MLGHYEVVIPSVELQHIYENPARLPIINSAETYEGKSEILLQTNDLIFSIYAKIDYNHLIKLLKLMQSDNQVEINIYM